MGFGKSHGFYKPKAGGKDTKDPSFHKQRYVIPRDNQTRKKDKEPSHHHAVRSPQKKRQKPVTEDEEEDGEDIQPSAIEVETVSPCIISSTVAEPLSSQSGSLVAQEVMPRELRSAKHNNKFISFSYLCIPSFFFILTTPHHL